MYTSIRAIPCRSVKMPFNKRIHYLRGKKMSFGRCLKTKIKIHIPPSRYIDVWQPLYVTAECWYFCVVIPLCIVRMILMFSLFCSIVTTPLNPKYTAQRTTNQFLFYRFRIIMNDKTREPFYFFLVYVASEISTTLKIKVGVSILLAKFFPLRLPSNEILLFFFEF